MLQIKKIYTYIHTNIYTYIHTHTHTQIHAHTNKYTQHTHTHKHTPTHIHMICGPHSESACFAIARIQTTITWLSSLYFNHYTNCYVAILYSTGIYAETTVQYPPLEKEILGFIEITAAIHTIILKTVLLLYRSCFLTKTFINFQHTYIVKLWFKSIPQAV